MMFQLITNQELEIILDSLRNSKIKFENYADFPSKEFKQKKIEEINEVISKILTYKKSTSIS